MSKTVYAKKFQKIIGGSDINGLFEEMMGMKDAAVEIILPKFITVRNNIRSICRTFHQSHDFLIKIYPEYADSLGEISKFATTIKESLVIGDSSESEEKYKDVDSENLNKLYRKIKNDTYVKQIIVMCSKLRKYESNFSDSTKRKENFVNQEPGLSFRIFDFSSLDLKAIWNNNKTSSAAKQYILTMLSVIYAKSHEIYKQITSPDVDVDKFTEVLVNAIAELKKQPKLSRCVSAFRRIEQSIQLLKDKFGDYYRETVISENPSMLVTNFIVDVSNQGTANASLTYEFKTIISYMHELSQKNGKSKDPNVQKVFAILQQNFNIMEQNIPSQPEVKAIPVETETEEFEIDELPLNINGNIGKNKEKQLSKKNKKNFK